jgi:hypothetical protein
VFCRVNAYSGWGNICAEHADFLAEHFDHDVKYGVFVYLDRYLIDFQAKHFDHDVKYGVFAYLDRYLIDFQAEHFDHDVKRVYSTNLGRKLDHRDECDGGAIRNYPYQFGRPFIDGAIANQPQVLVNGQPVATQADVKNRYPDGSVEFAVIAVVIPAIPASGSLSLTFQNQMGNNTPLTQAQMLAPSYNFDASMALASATAGVTQTASARTMLQNGDYKLWTSGPVAQTIMLGRASWDLMSTLPGPITGSESVNCCLVGRFLPACSW